MTRGDYHQKEDQKLVDQLQSKDPSVTTDNAMMAVRLRWIERIANSYAHGLQPGFGGGFTPDDDVWLDLIQKAIKNKTSPRPAHPDDAIDQMLAASGL